MSADLVEKFIADRSDKIVNEFLFVETVPHFDRAALEAVKDGFAVLVSFQRLPSSSPHEVDIIPVTIDKIEASTQNAEIRSLTDLLKLYYEHFLTSPSGKVSLPPSAPPSLASLVSSRLLQISARLLPTKNSEDREAFFSWPDEVRKFAQQLAHVPYSKPTSRWIEGLSYVWQAVGAGQEAEPRLRDAILRHALKLMVEAVGTSVSTTNNFVSVSSPDCLEVPCAAVIGALCDYMERHVEAIWWYRKYKAEDVQFSFKDLIPELAGYLTSNGEGWRSVSVETRVSCLEQISNKRYEDVLAMQNTILQKSYTPKKMPPVAVSPMKIDTSAYKVSIPIGIGKKSPQQRTRELDENDFEDLEYAAHLPVPNALDNALRASVAIPALLPTVPSMSTVQFLERPRQKLELSMALPVPIHSPDLASSYSINPHNSYHPGVHTAAANDTMTGDTKNIVPVSSHPMDVSEPPRDTTVQVDISKPNQLVEGNEMVVEGENNPSIQKKPEEPEVPEETIEERLKRRIALFGLVEHKKVPGDGNCQFYSLSDQLYGDFDHAAQIRAYAVAWLRDNAEMELENGAKLKEFGYNDEGWDHYCTLMSLPGTWGDHLTLVAVAEIYKVRIIVVSSVKDESQALIEIVPAPETDSNKPPRDIGIVFLCHYAEFHYGTLKPDDSEQ